MRFYWGLLVFVCPSLWAHEFYVDVATGGDTNPTQLQDAFDVETAYFGLGRINFSHEPERSGYYYELDAYGTRYNEDDEAATNPRNGEESHGEARLGFQWQPEMKYGPADFRVEANYHSRDDVFVYPPTGRVATVQNNLGMTVVVDNRFDADWAGVAMDTVVPLSEEADFIFSLSGQDRQYQNYVDLVNLDFQQAEFDLGFDKRIWPKFSLLTMIGAGRREYVERPARQLDGTLLLGTNLEYSLLEVENVLTYHMSNRWQLAMGFRAQERKDSEEGFYDMKHGRVFSRLAYKNRDIVDFRFSLAYVKREFDNTDDNAILAFEEEIVAREGFQVSAELVRNLNQGGWRTLDLVLGVDYESFEQEDDEFFTYDRGQAYVGLRWRPY